MKHKKNPTARRPSRPGAARAKQNIHARRPLHKRLLVHPFMVMVLLCAGVLIAGTTWRSFAVSYDVTATVPAQLPPGPATITSPASQQHFAVAQATVIGSCPGAQTYVKLFRNNAFSGAAQCASQTFQIQTSLSPGANQLTAQVYNQTNQAGPASAPITVYYDETSVTPPSPPASVPTEVSVSGIDEATYKQGSIVQASDNPTVQGWAPPFSTIVVTFHSDPLTCQTQADQSGFWTCTLDHPLPPGVHHVDIVATTTDGTRLNFPTFEITVVAAAPSLLIQAPAQPFTVRTDYRYTTGRGGQACNFDIALADGTAPYAVTADWGDGSTSSTSRSDASPFTVSHKYAAATSDHIYVVLIKATDAKGATALMQLSVVAKGTGLVLVSQSTTLNSVMLQVRQWLWVIWPAYLTVALMAIGYFLGEREEYRRLLLKKAGPKAAGRTK